MHNRYGDCYLKQAAWLENGDNPKHGTISCVHTVAAAARERTTRKFTEEFASDAKTAKKASRARCAASRCDLTPGSAALPVVVINLDKSKNRLAHIRAELAREGVTNWTRSAAVYGLDLNVSELVRQGVVHEQRPAKGNIGTALSHMKVWKRLAAGSYSADQVLVFEDDATLQPDFVMQTRRLLQLCHGLDYDMLMLGWYKHLTDASCQHAIPGRPEVRLLRCPSGLNTGTNAYILTKRGARRALEVLTPLRHTSKDIQLAGGSARLNWFGATQELAGHNWGMRSVRVYGLEGDVRARRPPPASRRAWAHRTAEGGRVRARRPAHARLAM